MAVKNRAGERTLPFKTVFHLGWTEANATEVKAITSLL
jgi:hypothetical protein